MGSMRPKSPVWDAVVGTVHLAIAGLAFWVRFGPALLVGLAAIMIGISTILYWRPGLKFGVIVGVLLLMIGGTTILMSAGIQTGSGQPYPGGWFAILGLVVCGWGLLCMRPVLFRRDSPGD